MFSKAKITRFNEVEGCAPPPGSYNPKLEERPVGGVLSKTQRFLEPPEEPLLPLNMSRTSAKSSTDDVSKTPLYKAPKQWKPQTRSHGKPKKVSSLQDLSKDPSAELRRLHQELAQLQGELDDAKVGRARLSQWMRLVQTVVDSSAPSSCLVEVVSEWRQLETTGVSSEATDLISQLSIKQQLLSEAEQTIETLRDQLGEAQVNLQATKELSDQADKTCTLLQEKIAGRDEAVEMLQEQLREAHANLTAAREEVKQASLGLQQEMAEKCENHDRIVSELYSHIAVSEESRAGLQAALDQAQSTIKDLGGKLDSAVCQISESETVKLELQNQLLQKCDLLEEFLNSQKSLQSELQMMNTRLALSEDSLTEMQATQQASKVEYDQEMNIMQCELSEATQLIVRLTEQVSATEARAGESEVANQQLISQLESLGTRYSSLEDCLADKENELTVLSGELSNAQKLQLESELTSDLVNLQLVELGTQHALLENVYSENLRHLRALEEELSETRQAKSVLQVNLASVESNVDILKEKLAELETLHQITTNRLESADFALDALEAQRDLLSTENWSLQTKLEESMDKTSAMEDRAMVLSQLQADTRQQLEQAKERLEEVETLRVQETAQLQCQIDELADRVEVLQAREQELEQQLEFVSESLTGTETERVELQSKLAKAETHVASLTVSVEQKTQELASMEQRLEEVNTNVSSLTEQLEQADALQAQLTRVYSAREKILEEQCDTLSQQLDSCMESVDLARAEQKELAAKTAEIQANEDAMAAQVKEAFASYEFFQKDIQTKMTWSLAQIEKLDQKCNESVRVQAEMEETIRSLEQQLAEADKAKEKLQRRLTGTKQVHKSTQDKLTNAEAKLLLMTAEEEKNKSEISALQHDKEEGKEKMSSLERKLTDLVSQNSMLEQDKESVLKNLEENASALSSAQKQLAEAMGSAVELSEQLTEAQREKRGLVEAREVLEARLSEAVEHLSIVQAELVHAKEHLQEHMEQANANIAALQEISCEAARDKVLAQEEAEVTAQLLMDLQQQLEEHRNTCNAFISTVRTKVDLLNNENKELNDQMDQTNGTICKLESEISEALAAKLSAEEELHEMKIKLVAAQDQLFDLKEEKEDLKLSMETLGQKCETVKAAKQGLEEEFAKAEKEWDLHEQKLQLNVKLLAEEVKLSEEKQIQFEAHISELTSREEDFKSQVEMLKREGEWAETRQLEMEETLNMLQQDKEGLIAKLVKTEHKVGVCLKNESLARAGLDACKDEVQKVSTMLSELREELKVLKDEFDEQDREITRLEDEVDAKDHEIEALRAEVNSAAAQEVVTMRVQLEEREREVAALRSETEKRNIQADEMEELLHQKLAELSRAQEQLLRLENHARDLNGKVDVLAEAEQQAQQAVEEKNTAQLQAHQASMALAAAREEFSQRWSTMEDSILNVETVEARNRELSVTDTALRSQLSLLEKESTRLRSGNESLRSRLAELELQEARASGHQNAAQKLSYMTQLKELVLKHQKNEEELYRQLVESDRRVVELQADMQRLSSAQQANTTVLGKSMMQPTASSLAKKTPRPRGKENDRSQLLVSSNRSMLATSTPLLPKLFKR